MPDWLTPLHMVDGVIAITLFEAVLLCSHRSRGLALLRWAPNLLSGLCLMLALHSVLAAAAWPWMALCLLGAGMAHGLDLARLFALAEKSRR